MPVSKSRKKKKSRSKTPNFSTNGSALRESSSPTRALAAIDDPWFTFVIFLSLVTGSTAAGGMKPPDFSVFSLVLGSLMAGRYLGGLLAANSRPITLHTISASIERLKRRAPADREHGQLIEVCLITVVIAALLSVLLSVTQNLIVTTLLLGSVSFLVYLRARLPQDPYSLLVASFTVLALPCLLAVLGVFAQQAVLHPEGAVLGLVPGSMLAASLIARYADLLEHAGWRRSREVTGKNGEPVTRPAGVAQTYTAFLLGGFFLVFLLSSLGWLPRPLMLVVITMFIAPKVATSFLEHTRSNQELFYATVRLAVVAGALTLVAGGLSRLG